MCPTDETTLTEAPVAGSESKPATAAVAAAPAKEPVDTRTLEEKLFAPLPKKAAPPAAASTPAPAPVKAAATPAPKPASPGSTTKMMETVYEDPAPQKSSKIAAVVTGGREISWNKIIPAVLAVVVMIVAFFIFHKTSAPLPANDLNVSANSADVDMEMNLRDSLSKNAALRYQNIDVRVNNGTVILGGEASSPAKIEQAIKAAKAMPGVHEVVNHMHVNPEVGVRSEGHSFSAGGLQQGGTGDASGLAEQAKAHQLVLAGDRAASHGDYKAAASFYKQALAFNPDDTAASIGYTQAMEKLQ
jgi:hypothetical protein